MLIALVESAFQLGWYEEAIVFCQEGIETNASIPRMHHMLAKSILGLSDLMNTGNQQRAYPNQHLKDNIEHALHSMLRANELAPGDAAIIHDLNYVTSLYQGQK